MTDHVDPSKPSRSARRRRLYLARRRALRAGNPEEMNRRRQAYEEARRAADNRETEKRT